MKHRRLRTRLGRAAVAAALLAVVLAGCSTSALDRDPTATSHPTDWPDSDEPSPQPEPIGTPSKRVTTVLIRPTMLELVAEDGTVLRELSYDLEATEIATTLAGVFGAQPEIEVWPGQCCEAGRITYYRWPGLQILDDHVGMFVDHDTWVDRDGPDVHDMNVRVDVHRAEVAGVRISTSTGYQIGDDLELLKDVSLAYVETDRFFEAWLEHGPIMGPSEIPGEVNAYHVAVQDGMEGGIRILAPLRLGVGRV
ncbi:hypothetical protein [Ruicaihuangia caeni]|uniref:hypothetical protein n=1 Tax=Ruicaihuangia caeni TaxID=3042517 RepID=UPI00338F875F